MTRRAKRRNEVGLGGVAVLVAVAVVCKVEPDLVTGAVQAVAEPVAAWFAGTLPTGSA